MGAVAVDGPSLFIWGVILILAFICTLLIDDDDQVVAQLPRSRTGKPGTRRRRSATDTPRPRSTR